MGRNKLTAEEVANRAAEKEALFASRRKNVKQTIQPPVEMKQETTPINTDGGSNSPDEVTPDPAAPVVKPVDSNKPDLNPDENFSPLGGNKTHRGYSRPQINPALTNTVIPEPVIITDNSAAEKSVQPPSSTTAPGSAPKTNPILPPAEGFNELSNKEKQESAAMTADLILGAYDRLHWLGRKFVSVDIDDLADEHRKGDLDMNVGVFENAETPGEDISIKEYFEDFNQQVEEEFIVTEEFKTAVRPPLERICQKRGWGASDELFLAFKFGEDIAVKTGILIGFKKLTNKYMQEFRDDHAKIKKRVDAQLKRRQEEEDRIAAAAEAAREKATSKAAEAAAAKEAAEAAAAKEKENADLKTGA